MATLNLTARLLCAADHAYSITADGPVPDSPSPPTPPWSSRVGYLTPPTGLTCGLERIDAALLGETASEIILAFRGTLPPQSPNVGQMILDWANDCDAALVPDPNFPGLVHQGFRDSLEDLWTKLAPLLQHLSAASPNKSIYVTGHSKGGAIAVLAAWRCRTFLANRQIFVCTFAAPRAGNNEFALTYDGSLRHTVRYEYADDIVPHLPPEDAFVAMFQDIPLLSETLPRLTLGYVSVGDLHFIDWNGKLVPDSPGLKFERFVSLARLMLQMDYGTIVADHCLVPGYAKAVLAGAPAG